MAFYSDLTVFLPRVHYSVSSMKIIQTFKDLKIGKVKSISISTTRHPRFNKAIVHFEKWFDSAKEFQLEVLNPFIKAKVVYENPWYWIVEPFTKRARKGGFSVPKENKNQVFELFPVPKLELKRNDGKIGVEIENDETNTIIDFDKLLESPFENISIDNLLDDLTQIQNNSLEWNGPIEDVLSETDYNNIENYEIEMEEKEIYEDYEKAVNGKTMSCEDLDRCEEYFNKLELCAL